MAKRSATSELNHDNWEREEEPEDAGTFARASEEAIKKRVIKTARRRNPLASLSKGDGESKPSAFSSFQGFGKTANPTTTTSNFSFLSNLTNTPQPQVNGTSAKSDSKTENTNSTSKDKPEINMFSISNRTNDNKDTSDKSDEYLAKLKGLNESVAKWISKHVEENPLINLEPVFLDYKKYFDELEKIKGKTEKSTNNDTEVKIVEESNTKKSDPTPPSLFGGNTPSSTAPIVFGPPKTNPTFTFGSVNNAPKTTTTEGANFSFASTISNTSSTGFSFLNTPASFSFGNPPKPTEQTKKEEENKNGEEDEDEPPKVEYNPVMEEDSIYTIKCKLFIKKGDNFGAGSVGNLFLKKVNDTGKVQLIVRADTNLGNILCNFILSESIPTKRMGKKDVMLVCMPLPDSKPPPTPVLLRVKTPEDADKLLETLEKHKK